MWHSDSSYLPDPLPLTFLHAQRVPAGLGDTLFVDMQAALDGLPPDLRHLIAGRHAEHDVRWTYKVKDSDLGESIAEIFARIGKSFPAVCHSTIISHPVTGKDALYLSPGYTVRLCGYSEEESRDILGRVFKQVLQPQLIVGYQWEPQDLLIWDNRSVIHCATPIPDNVDRLMYRIGVTDGPFFG
jgi:taurine dioxygenase